MLLRMKPNADLQMGTQGRGSAGGSPRWGEKCYYSGVCLETGEVEALETAMPRPPRLLQLRANHPGPLVVIWDNGPAHRGAAIRSYLTTPDLHLRLVALPAYRDFNADEPSGTGPEKRSRPTNACEKVTCCSTVPIAES